MNAIAVTGHMPAFKLREEERKNAMRNPTQEKLTSWIQIQEEMLLPGNLPPGQTEENVRNRISELKEKLAQRHVVLSKPNVD